MLSAAAPMPAPRASSAHHAVPPERDLRLAHDRSHGRVADGVGGLKPVAAAVEAEIDVAHDAQHVGL